MTPCRRTTGMTGAAAAERARPAGRRPVDRAMRAPCSRQDLGAAAGHLPVEPVAAPEDGLELGRGRCGRAGLWRAREARRVSGRAGALDAADEHAAAPVRRRAAASGRMVMAPKRALESAEQRGQALGEVDEDDLAAGRRVVAAVLTQRSRASGGMWRAAARAAGGCGATGWIVEGRVGDDRSVVIGARGRRRLGCARRR